jgi:Ca2+-binding EF-hand superfamily protein
MAQQLLLGPGGVLMQHTAASIRELKFGKSFDLIDADRDGVTTRSDWEEFAGYMCSQFTEVIESRIGKQVRESILSWWQGISGQPEGDDDRELTRVEFTAHYGNRNEDELDEVIRRCVDAVFALCDGNADGCLSRHEFAGLLRVNGVPEHELNQTIQHMIAGDGEISKDKYAGLVRDFYLSADTQSPGSWLFGRV